MHGDWPAGCEPAAAPAGGDRCSLLLLPAPAAPAALLGKSSCLHVHNNNSQIYYTCTNYLLNSKIREQISRVVLCPSDNDD